MIFRDFFLRKYCSYIVFRQFYRYSVLFYIFSQNDFSKVSTNIPLRSESGFDNFFCQIYVLFNEWNVFIIRMTVMNRTAFVFIPYNMNWFSKLTQSDWFWAVTSANLTNCPFKPVKHNVNVLLWDEFNSPEKHFIGPKKFYIDAIKNHKTKTISNSI